MAPSRADRSGGRHGHRFRNLVWLELLIHPTALFAFQGRPERSRLARLQTGRRARFFEPSDVRAIAVVGVLATAAVAAGYVLSLDGGVPDGRAMALSVLTLSSASLTVGLGRLRTRAAWAVPLGTTVLTVALVQVPALSGRLLLSPLHLADWLLAAGAAALLGLVAAGVEAR